MTDNEDEKLGLTIDSMKKDDKTVKEIAKALNISERKVYRLMSKSGSPDNNDSTDNTDSDTDNTDRQTDSRGGRPKKPLCQMTAKYSLNCLRRLRKLHTGNCCHC